MNCCDAIPAQLSPIKRGDTFILACTYKQDGVPTSVELFTIRAQVRDSSENLVQELNVAKPDQEVSPGVFVLSAGQINDWPLDLLRCDIQFSDEEGVVRSTQTFYIPVVEDVTR